MKIISCAGGVAMLVGMAVSVHIFNEKTYAKNDDLKDAEVAFEKTYATKADLMQLEHDVNEVDEYSHLVGYRVDVKITTDKLMSTQDRLWSLQRMIQNDYEVPKGTPSRNMPSKVPQNLIRQLQHLEQEEALYQRQINTLMKQK